jgi:hypothetical protein
MLCETIVAVAAMYMPSTLTTSRMNFWRCCSARAGQSVSAVIEDFERRGMLKGERGRLLIGDRDRPLGMSCDCYEAIKRSYQQVGR